jgi:hypothetical protein
MNASREGKHARELVAGVAYGARVGWSGDEAGHQRILPAATTARIIGGARSSSS